MMQWTEFFGKLYFVNLFNAHANIFVFLFLDMYRTVSLMIADNLTETNSRILQVFLISIK